MTSSTRPIGTNKKPSPPPGLPTLDQRIKAMQLAARLHSGYVPSTHNGNTVPAIKLVLPPELPMSSTPAGKIPRTIFVSVAPEIHYDNDFVFEAYDDDDDDDDNFSLASNNAVFRNVKDEFMEDDSSNEFEDTVPRPCIERQRAFGAVGSKESCDDRLTVNNEIYTQSVKTPACSRFMRGFKSYLFSAKYDPQGK